MKLVDLVPLKEGGAFGMTAKELAATYSLEKLQNIRDEIMGDMEQEAEPEGGRIADMYADQLQGVDDAIAIKNPFKKGSVGGMTYDQAIGRVSKDQFIKSKKFDRGGNRIDEATEKSWNAIDVSRKAEKEVDNKEWNSRTTAKLDMLIALNAAGKFKKDFDEERLQGWVDQNYSWEKLARQFKINEAYDKMFDFEPEDMDNPDEDLVIIGSGYLDIKSNFGERPPQTNGEYAEIGQKVVDQLHNGDKEAALDFIYSKINEGSCGYSQEAPGGEELGTPGGTKGMDADKRTISMMREVIRKEIAKLVNPKKADLNKDGELSDYEKTRGAAIEKNMKESNLDDKLKGAFSPEEWDKITSKPVPSFADIKPKPSKDKK